MVMRLLALLASMTTVAGQTVTNYVTNGDFSADTIPDSNLEFKNMNDPAPTGWNKYQGQWHRLQLRSSRQERLR